LAKKLWLTILLAVIVSGLGHIYLGFVKRGIIILVVGIALWITALFVFPLLFPEHFGLFEGFGLIGRIAGSWWGGAWWIGQLWDAYKHYKTFTRNNSVT